MSTHGLHDLIRRNRIASLGLHGTPAESVSVDYSRWRGRGRGSLLSLTSAQGKAGHESYADERPNTQHLRVLSRPMHPRQASSGLMTDDDADLRALLQTLDPKARDDLRRALIRDQSDRDAIGSRLVRYRDQNGQDWADIIDFLTMYPDARRQVVRLLGRSKRAKPGDTLGDSRFVLGGPEPPGSIP
jgi:hypothetical protein